MSGKRGRPPKQRPVPVFTGDATSVIPPAHASPSAPPLSNAPPLSIPDAPPLESAPSTPMGSDTDNSDVEMEFKFLGRPGIPEQREQTSVEVGRERVQSAVSTLETFLQATVGVNTTPSFLSDFVKSVDPGDKAENLELVRRILSASEIWKRERVERDRAISDLTSQVQSLRLAKKVEWINLAGKGLNELTTNFYEQITVPGVHDGAIKQFVNNYINEHKIAFKAELHKIVFDNPFTGMKGDSLPTAQGSVKAHHKAYAEMLGETSAKRQQILHAISEFELHIRLCIMKGIHARIYDQWYEQGSLIKIAQGPSLKVAEGERKKEARIAKRKRAEVLEKENEALKAQLASMQAQQLAQQ